MNLRNMSVGGRVGATLALVSGLFIVAVLIGWQGIGNVVTRSGAAGAEAGAAHAAAAAAYNMRLSQAQAVLNGGRVENADGSDTHRGDVAAFEKALEELHAVTHPDEYRDIKRAYATWTRTDERLRSLTAAGRHVAAVELVNGAGNEKGDTLATALSAIGREATNGAADAAVAQARAAHRKMLLAVLVALAGAALATLTLIRRLRRATGPILNRLNMLRDHCTTDLKTGLEAMAQGDLTIPITPVTPHIDDLGDDELGQIARAVNEIRDRTVASVEAYNATRASLSAIVADVAATADDVAGASTQMAETSQDAGRAVDEIAHAVGEVAQGAERQVRAVELVRGASTEMTAVTTDSSERVQEAARVAADTARLAAAGTEAIGRATTAMGSVREASEAATTAIQALGAKSDRIGDIVSAITRIAEQTNLLALNAAIEAARAGDHGRGFAVVADEVRKLAEESQTAAGSIGSLVEEIQAETRQAVRLVESGGERTHEGVGTVDEARTAFAAIGAEVERINEQVEHIAAAVEQIAATSARVDSEVGDVAAVAEQTSASSQQVSASAEETSASTQQIAASAQSLAGTADRLRQSVATFTLAT